MCPYKILPTNTKMVAKLQALMCSLEKRASTRVVEVEREKKRWESWEIDLVEVQHGGLKSYYNRSTQFCSNSGIEFKSITQQICKLEEKIGLNLILVSTCFFLSIVYWFPCCKFVNKFDSLVGWRQWLSFDEFRNQFAWFSNF